MIYNTLDKSLSVFLSSKYPLAISMLFVKDKNVWQNTIAPGKSFFLLAKYSFIFSISLFAILLPLYNSFSFAKSRPFNLTPS